MNEVEKFNTVLFVVFDLVAVAPTVTSKCKGSRWLSNLNRDCSVAAHPRVNLSCISAPGGEKI